MLENVLSRLLHDPVSVYLLVGDILATFAVGLGIIWEHGSPEIRTVANRWVIGGIIVETLCSVLLFAYDANVIGSQNDKIVSLDQQLIQVKSPRLFDDEKLMAAIKALPKSDVEVLYDKNAPDGFFVGLQVVSALSVSGWNALHNAMPIALGPPSTDDPLSPYKNSAQAAGGQPWGISVVSNKSPILENTAAGSLVLALVGASLPGTQINLGQDARMPDGRLRIVIGPKLP
jgi:hypothetical protein